MKPDFVDRLQRDDERRPTRAAVRSLLIAMAVMVALGLGFLAVWWRLYDQAWRNLLG